MKSQPKGFDGLEWGGWALQYLYQKTVCKITMLDVRWNRVSNIRVVNNLTNLEQLLISYNGINDISPVRNLKNLWYLSIAHNNIEDLSAIQYLPRLTHLSICYNPITTQNVIMNLIQTFIRKSRRDRLLFELTTGKRRYDGLSRFCHQAAELLDPARIVLSGADLDGRPDFWRFVEQHNETCLLLSPDSEMDNRAMQLHDAIRVAAGDSFVASFCTFLAAGVPTDKALDFGSHAAAITVTRMGAMPSLPTVTEVLELLRERGYEEQDLSLLEVLI